jgi:hypothetical protein
MMMEAAVVLSALVPASIAGPMGAPVFVGPRDQREAEFRAYQSKRRRLGGNGRLL